MTTDATQVTGSPMVAAGGAQPGDVLAERYELLELLDANGPSFGYRAIDQETERPVLVRILAGPPLDERTLADVIERLRGLIGVGGRFLSSLLDADREGRRPFTVEAWPPGTQLSAIVEARRARGEALGAREVLPVTARLVAALAAIPEPWFHGDVRAERVWVDTEGLRLTGAFLLAALPPALMSERVALVDAPCAPELAAGRAGATADRWGVAAIAWEALTSRAVEHATAPRGLAPDTLAALRRALDRAPDRRPPDLSPLLDAMAAQAGLAVPRIDPEAHLPPTAVIGEPPRARPRRIEGAAAEGTQEVSFDQILEARPVARRIEGAASEGTQEISFEQILDESDEATADDTARHAAIPSNEADGLDPRLVRAALGLTLESEARPPQKKTRRPDDSLDPRLVRAALGVTSADEISAELDELHSDELDEVPSEPDPARPAERARSAEAPASSAAHAPRRPAPTAAPAATPPVIVEETPQPASPTPAVIVEDLAPPRRAARGEGGGTAVVPRPEEAPVKRPSRAGPLIVVGALVIAIAIVIAGFLVRSWIDEERDSERRARHIQERLQQIRSGDTP